MKLSKTHFALPEKYTIEMLITLNRPTKFYTKV